LTSGPAVTEFADSLLVLPLAESGGLRFVLKPRKLFSEQAQNVIGVINRIDLGGLVGAVVFGSGWYGVKGGCPRGMGS